MFDTFPYLVAQGSKESGKTKQLKLLGSLAFNAAEATGLMAAALYLEVQSHGATLLLDDQEDLGDEEAKAIKSMLNTGYKKNAATIRGDWDAQTARRYSLYSLKMITTIAGVDQTLAGRCIVIDMQPSLDPEIRDRGEDPGSPLWSLLRENLYVWALSDWQKIRDSYHAVTRDEVGLEGLSGRAWELWRPLIAIGSYLEAEGVRGVLERPKKVATSAQRRASADAADTREGAVLSYLLDG